MFPATPKTLWQLGRFGFIVNLLLVCVSSCFHYSWFANVHVIASNVLATSTTARSLTFAWVVLCLCPFPISFIPRASDVRPAINWSLMSSSTKSWYSQFAAWFRILVSHDAIDSFSSLFFFLVREGNFCRSPDTPTLAPYYYLNVLTTPWGFFKSASLKPRVNLYGRSSRGRERHPEACHGFIRLGLLGFVGFFRCIVPIFELCSNLSNPRSRFPGPAFRRPLF